MLEEKSIMPIITKLSIKGFKSIWQDSLDLGQLNVFIGTNGAGKSNLLEAIAVLSSSLEGGIDYERLQKRGARLSSSAIFRSAFKNKNRTSSFNLSAELGSLTYSMDVNAVGGFRYLAESVKINGSTVAGRSNNGATVNKVSLQSKLDNTKGIFPYLQAYKTISMKKERQDILEPLESLINYAIYAPSTPLLRGVEVDSSVKEPLGIYGGRLADALHETIQFNTDIAELRRFFKLLNWIKGFGTTLESDPELISGQMDIAGRKVWYQDRFMRTNFNQLYAYDVSEGALYILFMLTLLTNKRSPNMFALDNIDTALNPGLVRNLMTHIVQILKNKPEKQIFLTTHNPTTLDAVDLFDDSHRLFVVERDKDGHTKSRRIVPPKGMTKEEWEEKYFGMKLSEIWLSGAIEGMPTGF